MRVKESLLSIFNIAKGAIFMKRILAALLALISCASLFCFPAAADVRVCGREFPENAVEINLSGIPMTSTAEVEAALESFPNLQKVVMCRCGLSDTVMDALNRKYENIRFVWEIPFGAPSSQYWVRTDTDIFAPVMIGTVIWGPYLEDMDKKMPYLTDLEIIDLGHQQVTNVEWARHMPNLSFLILGESHVSDLSPLTECHKLKYLELCRSERLMDLSPLAEITSLEDLNISSLYADSTPILKMTWLKHLWANLNHDAWAKLRGKMPDTVVTCFDKDWEVSGGWWETDNYREMRDRMGMPYLGA